MCWILLLSGAAVFAVLLSFLNWFLFVKEPAQPAISDAQNTITFSRSALDEVLSSFEKKGIEYNALRSSLPSIADPGK
jgi:hypothetical protein